MTPITIRMSLFNSVSKTYFSIFLFVMFIGQSGSVAGQTAYTPDIAEFNGTNGYAFPASDSLALTDGGTIEFWVQCDWKKDPQYDPVILSNAGPKGALYTVSILGDRTGINLQAADKIESVPFDCTKSQMNYVAIVDFSDSAAVLVNGSVAGILDFGFSERPSSGFWIGSSDGTTAPFMGAIAGLRLWDVALDRSDLVKYSTLDVTLPDTGHPEINALAAKSDFTKDTLVLYGRSETPQIPTP